MDIPTDPVVMIEDLDTLRVISDPLRMKILQTAIDINKHGSLCSVKQISDMLDIPPARLYYHIKLLETHQLLQVADTRVVSGILEKLYRVRSYRIMVSQELFGREGVPEVIYPVFSGMFDDILEDLRKLMTRPSSELMQNNIALSRVTLRLPKNKIAEFSQRIEKLLKAAEEQENLNEGDETDLFTVFYAMYPDVKK